VDGRITVEIAGTVDVETWSARAADEADTAGAAPTPLGDGNGRPAFEAPPAGSWVVAVHVVFGDGLGSAVYFWHVVTT
jgi:hypothetical protein